MRRLDNRSRVELGVPCDGVNGFWRDTAAYTDSPVSVLPVAQRRNVWNHQRVPEFGHQAAEDSGAILQLLRQHGTANWQLPDRASVSVPSGCHPDPRRGTEHGLIVQWVLVHIRVGAELHLERAGLARERCSAAARVTQAEVFRAERAKRSCHGNKANRMCTSQRLCRQDIAHNWAKECAEPQIN